MPEGFNNFCLQMAPMTASVLKNHAQYAPSLLQEESITRLWSRVDIFAARFREANSYDG